MVDVVCYFARQYYEPNKKIRKKGARKYYTLLYNVLNQHTTTNNQTNFIVEKSA